MAATPLTDPYSATVALGNLDTPEQNPPLELKVLQVLQVFIAVHLKSEDLPAQFPSLLSFEQASYERHESYGTYPY